MKTIKTTLAAAAMMLALPFAMPAAAQEFPLVAGEYTEVSGIFVHDGASFKYADHLVKQWVRSQEFAKSKGWISDYRIYSNVNPRDGEPNLYLTVTYASMVDAAEGERRNKEFQAWDKVAPAQRDAESGNRAEYRTLKSSMLLQEYRPR